MRTIVIFVVLVVLLGCQEKKLTYEDKPNLIESAVLKHLEKFEKPEPQPCPTSSGRDNNICGHTELPENSQAGRKLINIAKQNGLDDGVALILMVGLNGKVVQVGLKNVAQGRGNDDFFIKRDPDHPGEVPPRPGANPSFSVELFNGSYCLRWSHNVTVGGTYYTDYCRFWVN